MANSKAKGFLVPPFPKEVLSTIASVGDPWLLAVNDHIELFNKIVEHLPHPYRWHFRTVAAFKAELTELFESGAGPAEVNKLYWEDVLNNCEAYSIMSICKMVELARSAVWAVARQDFVCAAIIARSTLESAAHFVDLARTLAASLNPLSGHDFMNVVVQSEELEDLLLKTVFASRLPGAEDYYSPTNIVTIIDRIAKSPGQETAKNYYGLLCEVAHPNFIGRSVYILETELGSRAGGEIRTLGLGVRKKPIEILIATIGAVSWAVGTQCSATQLMQSSIGSVKSALPKI